MSLEQLEKAWNDMHAGPVKASVADEVQERLNYAYRNEQERREKLERKRKLLVADALMRLPLHIVKMIGDGALNPCGLKDIEYPENKGL